MPFNLGDLREGSWQPREDSINLPGLWRLFLPKDGTRESVEAFMDSLESPTFPLRVEVDGEERTIHHEIEANVLRAKHAVEELGAVWRVRGLTDAELQQCQENVRGRRNKAVAAFSEAITGIAEGELMDDHGMDEDMPAAAALRIEHVALGSVEPAIAFPDAKALSDAFPIEFRMIAAKIVELSGLGAVNAKKSQPSGQTQKSS